VALDVEFTGLSGNFMVVTSDKVLLLARSADESMTAIQVFESRPHRSWAAQLRSVVQAFIPQMEGKF
jgi:hypothetical protein